MTRYREILRLTSLGLSQWSIIQSIGVLVIEDFGLMDVDMGKCRDLFEILETRDSRKSTMIVS